MSTDKVGNEAVNIRSLIGKKNFTLKLVDTSYPEYYQDGQHISYGYTFPTDNILVHDVREGNYDSILLCFYHHGCRTSAMNIRVPNDFMVMPASAEESVALLYSYNKWAENNLPESLRLGMHIGTDPEIFATDQEGKLIPAWEFLGSKASPSLTDGMFSHGSNPMYWDGFGAEFTTKATTCMEYQLQSIYCGIKGVYDHMKAKFPTANLTARSVLDINPTMMMSATDEQTEFGCNPSFNAYGITTDLPPGREVPFRSAGGHIHFGIENTSHEEAIPMVKSLDAILGVACVSLFDGYDSPQRRQYYGIPGEYRLPPHGVEYRSLSNGWLMHPMITYLVFDLGRKALLLGKKGLFDKMWKGDEQEVIDCMTRSDATKARELMDRNKDLMCKLLVAAYSWSSSDPAIAKALYAIFYKGIASRIEEPTNIARNWNLRAGWIGPEYRTHSIINNHRELVTNPNKKF